MPRKDLVKNFFLTTPLVFFLAWPVTALAGEAIQEWQVINPAGTIAIKPIQLAPRVAGLEGKTVVLRWNGKHNGNNYLDRIAELFAEKLPGANTCRVPRATDRLSLRKS